LGYEKNKGALGTHFRRVEDGCAVLLGLRLEHGKRFSHTKAKAKNAPRHEAGKQTQSLGLALSLAAVFFHPDYDRRLRHLTGSADLPAVAGSARGLVAIEATQTS
jgi:hypothetical protein